MESFVDQNQYLWAVIDAIPSLIFVVDPDLEIVDANSAARLLFGKRSDLAGRRLCGDVMRCYHEVRSGRSCGTTKDCGQCIIRTAITTSSNTKAFYRRQYRMTHQVDGVEQEMEYLVTASPINCSDRSLFLLVMEDISELAALRHIATACSYCTRIRNEEGKCDLMDIYPGRPDRLSFAQELSPSRPERSAQEATTTT